MSSHYLRIFQQPKSAILLILGFASGLPLALTSGTLQAWMTVENIDLKTIGFFSLVGQAYALALGILTLGCLLLAVWLGLLILNALDYTSFSFLSGLLEVAALTAVGGILFGGLLDYLALRKTHLI